jgi:2-oxo-4-hydroxy-4-carboxy--5-ureidoimidazoline (OHCU) decarboxylase
MTPPAACIPRCPRLPHRVGGGTPRRAERPSRPRREARRAKRLTADSTAEQASAGLDALTDAERAAFTELNAAYTREIRLPLHHRRARPRQGGHPRRLPRRIDNDREAEFAEACRQVERIAELRLMDLLR